MKNKLFFSICVMLIYFIALKGISSQNNQKVKIYTILKNNEEQISYLTNRLTSLQDKYAILSNKIQELNNRLSEEKQKNKELKSKINTLQKQLEKQRKYINKKYSEITDKVISETKKLIKEAKSNNNRGVSQSNKRSPEKYIEYKVQKGATLSAIAKAYNVSIKAIKEANNMQADLIRAGEIIYIPKNNEKMGDKIQ